VITKTGELFQHLEVLVEALPQPLLQGKQVARVLPGKVLRVEAFLAEIPPVLEVVVLALLAVTEFLAMELVEMAELVLHLLLLAQVHLGPAVAVALP
jgi:hypothetical protein